MTFDELEKAIRARGDSTVGGGASSSALADAERRLSVTFPASLREYLRRFGWLELGHMELYGLGSRTPPHLNLVDLTLSERTEAGVRLPEHLIPLLNDGGGNLYCIDAKQGSNRHGGIVLWNHEAGPLQDPAPCASSLEAWLAERVKLLDER